MIVDTSSTVVTTAINGDGSPSDILTQEEKLAIWRKERGKQGGSAHPPSRNGGYSNLKICRPRKGAMAMTTKVTETEQQRGEHIHGNKKESMDHRDKGQVDIDEETVGQAEVHDEEGKTSTAYPPPPPIATTDVKEGVNNGSSRCVEVIPNGTVEKTSTSTTTTPMKTTSTASSIQNPTVRTSRSNAVKSTRRIRGALRPPSDDSNSNHKKVATRARTSSYGINAPFGPAATLARNGSSRSNHTAITKSTSTTTTTTKGASQSSGIISTTATRFARPSASNTRSRSDNTMLFRRRTTSQQGQEQQPNSKNCKRISVQAVSGSAEGSKKLSRGVEQGKKQQQQNVVQNTRQPRETKLHGYEKPTQSQQLRQQQKQKQPPHDTTVDKQRARLVARFKSKNKQTSEQGTTTADSKQKQVHPVQPKMLEPTHKKRTNDNQQPLTKHHELSEQLQKTNHAVGERKAPRDGVGRSKSARSLGSGVRSFMSETATSLRRKNTTVRTRSMSSLKNTATTTTTEPLLDPTEDNDNNNGHKKMERRLTPGRCHYLCCSPPQGKELNAHRGLRRLSIPRRRHEDETEEDLADTEMLLPLPSALSEIRRQQIPLIQSQLQQDDGEALSKLHRQRQQEGHRAEEQHQRKENDDVDVRKIHQETGTSDVMVDLSGFAEQPSSPLSSSWNFNQEGEVTVSEESLLNDEKRPTDIPRGIPLIPTSSSMLGDRGDNNESLFGEEQDQSKMMMTMTRTRPIDVPMGIPLMESSAIEQPQLGASGDGAIPPATQSANVKPIPSATKSVVVEGGQTAGVVLPSIQADAVAPTTIKSSADRMNANDDDVANDNNFSPYFVSDIGIDSPVGRYRSLCSDLSCSNTEDEPLLHHSGMSDELPLTEDALETLQDLSWMIDNIWGTRSSDTGGERADMDDDDDIMDRRLEECTSISDEIPLTQLAIQEFQRVPDWNTFDWMRDMTVSWTTPEHQQMETNTHAMFYEQFNKVQLENEMLRERLLSIYKEHRRYKDKKNRRIGGRGGGGGGRRNPLQQEQEQQRYQNHLLFERQKEQILDTKQSI